VIIEYKGHKPVIAPGAFVAPNATLIGKVEIKAGASVWFGAVLRGDHGRIVVDEGSSVQDNVVLHAPEDGLTHIGKNVVVGHGSVLEGCRIGDGAVIGMNTTVLVGAVIGEQAMLAAGSVATDGTEIPPRTLAAGVPAKVKKELDGKALRWIEYGAQAYHKFAEEYQFLMEAEDEAI
jgi:carbonic anhydrase/acetyltransferase-like protein (isoleucine patch superfamily)